VAAPPTATSLNGIARSSAKYSAQTGPLENLPLKYGGEGGNAPFVILNVPLPLSYYKKKNKNKLFLKKGNKK